MSPTTTSSVVRQIESLFAGGAVAGMTDRELIERYRARRDAAGEAAFAALVSRHGPMVLEICGRIVGDPHHAEDAFQAVFLVLARKARSLANPDLLANWLYGVALHTARRARLQIARRRKNDKAAMGKLSAVLDDRSVSGPEHRVLACEQAESLYAEIDRLPGPFRVAVVLCYLEGLTFDEAARRLCCPPGTVRSRLARACEKLRRGLVRRGFALSAAGVTSTLAARPSSASVSSSLCETTTRTAVQYAAGSTAAGATLGTAASLARGVLRSLLVQRLKVVAMALVVLGAATTSVRLIAQAPERQADFGELSRAGKPDLPQRQAGKPDLREGTKPDDAGPKPAPGRMFVVGRVLDPGGQPVPGATVMAAARSKVSSRTIATEGMSMNVIGHATADGSARYRVDAPRTSSARNDEFLAVALAPGYGVGWVALDADAPEPGADIRLMPEQLIHGRLFDVQGRPAAGVLVSVFAIQRTVIRDAPGLGPLRRKAEGPFYWWARTNDWPAWPRPMTTDADGKFTLHGVGRGLDARLTIIDPRFALQMISIEADSPADAKSVKMALLPAKTITGGVTYSDTGKPVAHATITVLASEEGQIGSRPTYFETDADGRYRANPSPGDRFSIAARAPAGQPYVPVAHELDWPKGAVERSVDLALERGVMIRGKVTDEGSHEPIAGAVVVFQPFRQPGGAGGESVTGVDGSFAMAVSPRTGHLAVKAPNEDYVVRVIGNQEFATGKPGGRPLYSHAFVPCEAKESGPALELGVGLHRGVTVSGRVVGPDDQPIINAWIVGRLALMPSPWAWHRLRGDYHRIAFNGRFELHGVDPEAEVPVVFFEPTRKLAATVHLSGKSAATGPITVRLEPCGTAKARLVDGKNRPVTAYRDPFMISMIISAHVDQAKRGAALANLLPEESDYLVRIDPVNHQKPPVPDTEGRIVLRAMIPGVTYRIIDRTAAQTPDAPPIRKEFTVKPGETLDLGDILIEKPRS